MKKKTISTFKKAKQQGNKLAVLTAYDYSTAKIFDEEGIDAILVGDSLGMVVLGYENTLSVTMDDMLYHTKAAARGTKRALLIADMPFMSYQTSVYDAVKNAGRLVQEANAACVKLEGAHYLEHIKAIIKTQIPVMGHLGLTPQSIHTLGGFKIQGKTNKQAQQILDDAKRIEDTGVFSLVLECIPAYLAEIITKTVCIPTIGIGAGIDCDGQVLVYQDIFGIYSDITPKFVKIFADINHEMRKGVRNYITEVKSGAFPSDEYSFHLKGRTTEK